MTFKLFNDSDVKPVVALFQRVFSDAEGEAEGQVIADFVKELVSTTPPSAVIGFTAWEGDAVVGGIFFSQLIVPSGQRAFILSPVAVSTDVQRRGIGQALIRYGLDHLKLLGVELVFTYGDPGYYSKVGFEQITETIVKAPCPLSQPIGWLAQSLDGGTVQAMSGPTRCVEALNDPGLW
jgi:predicted N-acetyltransferase YhbS